MPHRTLKQNPASTSIKDGLQSYCGGLTFAGKRPLNEDERPALVRMKQRFRRNAFAWIAAIPLITILPFAVGFAVGEEVAHSFVPFMSGMLILAIFLGIPFAILRSRDLFRRTRVINETLDRSNILIFKGNSSIEEVASLLSIPIRRFSDRTRSDVRVSELECHAKGSALYSVNGATVSFWENVNLIQAAPPPKDAIFHPLPTEWLVDQNLISGTYRRRGLSPDEIKELNSFIKKMKRDIWKPLLVAGFASAGLLNALLMNVSHLSAGQRILLIGLAVTPLCSLIYFRLSRHFRTLEDDLDSGWVVRCNSNDFQSPAEPAPVPAHIIEYLAVSRNIWTVAGIPADWRGC